MQIAASFSAVAARVSALAADAELDFSVGACPAGAGDRVSDSSIFRVLLTLEWILMDRLITSAIVDYHLPRYKSLLTQSLSFWFPYMRMENAISSLGTKSMAFLFEVEPCDCASQNVFTRSSPALAHRSVQAAFSLALISGAPEVSKRIASSN